MNFPFAIALLATAVMPALAAAACPELLNHKFTTLQGRLTPMLK